MNEDIIGQALLDYFNKEYDTNIIVKSSIAEDDIINVPYLFRTSAELPQLEKEALKYCKGKVLDVGAGAGCHSILLKEKKIDVTAIDTSEGAIEVMKKRGLSACQTNFYDVKGKYDTLLFLMNGVGIAGKLKYLPLFFKKAVSLLNAEGQIILDSSDISYMFKEDDGSMWVDLNNAYYGEVNYQMMYKNVIGEAFDWLFVDFPTLEKTANLEGFKAELIFEGDNGHYLARLIL